MKKLFNILFVTLGFAIAICLLFGFAFQTNASWLDAFLSRQVGTDPVANDVLVTDGTDSSWSNTLNLSGDITANGGNFNSVTTTDTLYVGGGIETTVCYQNEPLIYNGREVSIVSPYNSDLNEYQVALHNHTENSDDVPAGTNTPTALEEFYRDNGYNVVQISDHDVFTPDPSVANVIHLNGVEESSWPPEGAYGHHVNSINAIEDITASSTPQEVIDNIIEDGAFAFLNHPKDVTYGHTLAEMESLNKYSGIEIRNSKAEVEEGEDPAEDQWDILLSEGKHLFALSTNDCHDISEAHCLRGAVNVFAQSSTTDDIMDSMVRGNFYSTVTSTKESLSISVSKRNITATTDEASTIEFIIDDGAIAQTDSSVTTDTYQVIGNERYVRVRVTSDSDGGIAYSNPIYIELEKDFQEFGGLISGDVKFGGNTDMIDGKYYKYDGFNMLSAITENDNYFFGPSGNLTQTGERNTAGGYASQISQVSGNNNTSFGALSMANALTSWGNSAFGFQSLLDNTDGGHNTAIGYGSQLHNTTGESNTSIGYASLYNNSTGNGNVALGFWAGTYETGSNSFYVNNFDRVNTAGDKSDSLLYGTMAGTPVNQQLTVNGNLNSSWGALTVGSEADSTGPDRGIYFGASQDVGIYRSGAGELTTEGDMVVMGSNVAKSSTSQSYMFAWDMSLSDWVALYDDGTFSYIKTNTNPLLLQSAANTIYLAETGLARYITVDLSSDVKLQSTTGIFNFDNDNLLTTGYASTTGGLFTQSTLHVGGNSDIDGNLTLNNITGSTQCLQIDTNGLISGTGAICGGGVTSGIWTAQLDSIYQNTTTDTVLIGTNTLTDSSRSLEVLGDSYFTGVVTTTDKIYAPEICLQGDCRTGWPSGTSPLTTKGDLYTYDTDDARLPIGTDTYVLTADSSEATGMKWAASSGGGGSSFSHWFTDGSGYLTTTSTSQLFPGYATTTNNHYFGGYASSTLGFFSQGDLVIGGTATSSKFCLGDDCITEWPTGGGGLTWTEVTGTTQQAAVNNGYIANNAAPVVVTIPDACDIGDVIKVAGKGVGGWKVAQNAGDTIHFLNLDTTTGVTGYASSSQQFESIELMCITENTNWTVLDAVGNIYIE